MYPSWGDDPDLVLELIRTYLSSATSSDPNEMEKKGIKERENATKLVFESLDVRILDRIFPIKRLVFKRLLQLTQKYMMLRENQQFYIGQGYPIARAIVLEIGSRFADKKIINEPTDVFFLKVEEIRSIILGSRERHIQMMVEERKKEFESFKKVEPPSLITKDGAKEWSEKEILKGIGGSPGMVSGTAKIILDIEDFSKFKEGEILIAPTTNPSWTPLFIMAKAVVTEVGGLLSHGAVVAREYGIPAVLGVKNATRRLKNGQKITVDGGSGMVYTKD
jgi:pyruvate,water dikinase